MSPALWGQADGNNPALVPSLISTQYHRDNGPSGVKTSALQGQKTLIGLHLGPTIPNHLRFFFFFFFFFFFLGGGEAWIKMTGA